MRLISIAAIMLLLSLRPALAAEGGAAAGAATGATVGGEVGGPVGAAVGAGAGAGAGDGASGRERERTGVIVEEPRTRAPSRECSTTTTRREDNRGTTIKERTDC